MSITVKPTHPDFVTEISGVDLARPLKPADRDAIEDAINRYAIVVFHDQKLTDEQQIDFARHFGPINSSAQKARHTGIKHRIASNDIADISNLDGDGNVLAADNKRRLDWLANRLWHTDASFRAVPGALSMLYAHVVPDEGGDTEFADLRAAGASVQRCLWASTGTKNPAYSDVMYVEELIGPETVNTMPQQTMMAFKEHGEVRPSLLENVEGARQVLRDLAALGIDMDKVTTDLRVDGVKLFADSIDKLLEEIANKKKQLKQGSVGAHEAQLGTLDGAVNKRLEQLEQTAVVRRIAEKDAAPHRIQRGALFRVVKDEAIHHLDGRAFREAISQKLERAGCIVTAT